MICALVEHLIDSLVEDRASLHLPFANGGHQLHVRVLDCHYLVILKALVLRFLLYLLSLIAEEDAFFEWFAWIFFGGGVRDALYPVFELVTGRLCIILL